MLNQNGVLSAFVSYRYGRNMLTIYTTDAWSYYSKLEGFVSYDEVRQAKPVVVDHPTPNPAPKSGETERKTDCAIVASEMYARLTNKGVYWVNMMELPGIWFDDVKQSGHAVCVWKIAADASVLVYDEGIGTSELGITSENGEDILHALEIYYTNLLGRRVTLDGHLAKH
jgi:hypothetical protein